MPLELYNTDIDELLFQLSSSANIEQVLKGVVELSKKVVGAEYTSLYLLENGQITHHILTSAGDFPEVAKHKIIQSMKEGLAGWVYKHKQGTLSSDVRLDERWITMGNENKFGSAIVVPLMIQSKMIAILTLIHSQNGFFHEYHLAVAANYAKRAAIIVENIRLSMRNKELAAGFMKLLSSVDKAVMIIENNILRYINKVAINEFSISGQSKQLIDYEWGVKIIETLQSMESSNKQSMAIEMNGIHYKIIASPLPGFGLGLLFEKSQ